MRNNIFSTKQILLNKLIFSHRWHSKHWQSLLGLSLLFFTFFSLYSPTKGYHINTDQEQTFYNRPSPTQNSSTELPDPCTSSHPQEVQEVIVSDTLFIGVQPDMTLRSVRRTLQVDGVHDLTVEKFWPEFNLALVRLPEQESSPIMAAHGDAIQRLEGYRQMLEQISAIEYVDYNSWVSIPTWTEPAEIAQSAPTRWHSTESVEEPASSEEAIVALIDSGYRTLDMDDTTYSLWENQAEIDGITGVDDDENGFIDDYNGWDWVDNDNVMNDGLGHGILIGNTILDVIEQQGINRQSVKIQPLRILREDGKGEIADLVDALAYAARKGISIVNLSLVSHYNAPALEMAIEIVHQGGMLAVSPAGPCIEKAYWPASYPETFATSAICNPETSDDTCQINGTADIAVQVDASAVLSPSLTSLDSPHVTAAAALILGQRPASSNTDIESLILSTAASPEDLPAEILVLDIDAILEELERVKQSVKAPPLDRKLYLPLITN